MSDKIPAGAFVGFATPAPVKPEPVPEGPKPDTFTSADRELLNNLASVFIFWASHFSSARELSVALEQPEPERD